MDLYIKILKEKFGYDTLKPFQEEIMKHLNKDILILSPTGSGKSICFQLPSLIDNTITIVISPLKSLIEDQINDLKNKNINCAYINSDLSKKEKTEFYKKLKDYEGFMLLYLTPEAITQDEKLINILKDLHIKNKIARIVIDEAHCVSIWGHDFRDSYLKLEQLKIQFKDVKIMALTATATKKVREDITNILKLDNPHIEVGSFFRNNLNLKIVNRNDTSLIELRDLIKKNYAEQSGIIYCNSRRETEKISSYLDNYFPTRAYHAGLHDEIRKLIQKQWLIGQIKVIVATIAFGMGINKPDVRYVIHYNLPSSIEGYYQEIGRAGRDGKLADCILMYSYQDKFFYDRLFKTKLMKNTYKDFQVGQNNIDDVEFVNTENDTEQPSNLNLNINFNLNLNLNVKPKEEESKQIELNEFMYYQISKLHQTINYIENMIDCRHYQLLSYFGQMLDNKNNWCNGLCDNCIRHKKGNHLDEIDFTNHSKNILKIIYDRKNIKLEDKLEDNSNITTISKDELIKLYNKIEPSMTPLNLERLIIKLFNLGYIKDNVVKNEKNIWKDDLNITDKYYNFDEETKNNKITLLVNQSKYFIDNFLDKINDITTTATSPPSPIMNDNTNSNKNTNTNKNNKNTLGNPSQDVLNELGTLSFSFELMDDNLQEKYNLTHLPLYQKLITYRIEEAKRKKISQNRVFSNKTIEDIIRNTPSNEQELKNIVGIGEAKIKEFGKDLLKIIKSCS